MVNYMVAVDSSKNAKAAFYTALNLINKEKDHLYVITVVLDVGPYMAFTLGDMPSTAPFYAVQQKAQEESEELLRYFGAICYKQQIPCTLLYGVSNHIGDMICKAVEKRNIHCVVMGRRGMTKLKRLFVGSNSQYCLEHANCDVLIAKGEWGPAEQHVDIQDIDKMEEEERKRRVADADKDKQIAATLTQQVLPIIKMHYKEDQ